MLVWLYLKTAGYNSHWCILVLVWLYLKTAGYSSHWHILVLVWLYLKTAGYSSHWRILVLVWLYLKTAGYSSHWRILVLVWLYLKTAGYSSHWRILVLVWLYLKTAGYSSHWCILVLVWLYLKKAGYSSHWCILVLVWLYLKTATSTHILNFKFKVVIKQNDGIFVKQPKYRCTGWEPCAKYPTEKAIFHCYHSVSWGKTTTWKAEGTRTGMHLLRLLTAHCWRVNGSNPTWTVWQRAVTSGHIWNRGDKTMDLKCIN